MPSKRLNTMGRGAAAGLHSAVLGGVTRSVLADLIRYPDATSCVSPHI